jgi:L-alanine-DL-glutamate epimerase-like enolase superfamily enzyme
VRITGVEAIVLRRYDARQKITIQADVAHAGSLTDRRRIAQLARTRGVPSIPDALTTGIPNAATLSPAALPATSCFQLSVSDTPLAHDLVHFGPMIAVPQASGLEITVDDPVVQRYRVG